MAGLGWSWVVGVNLWLVVGDGRKIMVGRGWSCVVARFNNTPTDHLRAATSLLNHLLSSDNLLIGCEQLSY